MTLQATGNISFSELQSEYGGEHPISMSEYYRNGLYVPSSVTTTGTFSNLVESESGGGNGGVFWRYYDNGSGPLPTLNSGDYFYQHAFWTDQAYTSGTSTSDNSMRVNQGGTYTVSLGGYQPNALPSTKYVQVFVDGSSQGTIYHNQEQDFSIAEGATLRLYSQMSTTNNFHEHLLRVTGPNDTRVLSATVNGTVPTSGLVNMSDFYYGTVSNFKLFDAPGTFSFIVPEGVSSVEYTVYGAGGGSGACNNNGDAWVGAGGGAGGKTKATMFVTAGETLTIVVGNRGYGASYRFNSDYRYNPNNSTLGVGTAGGTSEIKRGATVLASATGGGAGAQYYQGDYGEGGSPEVADTSPPSHIGNGDGEKGSSPVYKGYGYTGPIKGGTNGSGTPPSGYGDAGTGYGNGGGQSGLGIGADGQDGAVLLSWS